MMAFVAMKTSGAVLNNLSNFLISFSYNYPLWVADSLTTGKALDACKEAREAHKGESDYRIAHPYSCTKYIWCYSGGLNGDEVDCGTGKFNPAYTDPKAPCKDSVPECIQT